METRIFSSYSGGGSWASRLKKILEVVSKAVNQHTTAVCEARNTNPFARWKITSVPADVKFRDPIRPLDWPEMRNGGIRFAGPPVFSYQPSLTQPPASIRTALLPYCRTWHPPKILHCWWCLCRVDRPRQVLIILNQWYKNGPHMRLRTLFLPRKWAC